MDQKMREWQGHGTVPVWDLPTRLFHWLLVALVAASFATGRAGGNAMIYHEWCGEAILALLIFRIVWGFIGSAPSRFSAFLAGPSTVFRYALTLLRRDEDHHLSHNPLGGWSVMAMLLVLLIQAGTGLFANDDIFIEGPLYEWVSKATSDRLTSIHHFNHDVIMVLVAVHVAAVLFHLFYKQENLILPMITGRKPWKSSPKAALTPAPIWQAALAAVAAAVAVYLLVQ
ncbi:MAG: cytochrome b/b6 domain-containing protein [Desulfobacterales bacterium]|nr:cytochrome b/b6 domain-containing protein [Desulfobacterales bacterium]